MKRATCTQKARSRPPKLEHHIKRRHVVHAIIMTVVPWKTGKITVFLEGTFCSKCNIRVLSI